MNICNTSNINAIIIGFDGGDDALDAIEKGEMTATVAQQPEIIGSLGIETMDKVLKGESVDSFIPVELQLIARE